MTRAARRLVLLAALTVALVGLAVGPASAHDELIATDPAVDATVEQAPTSVTLTFRAAVLRTGAAIEVSGPDGASWSTGDVGISGATVNREMRSGAPAGRYAVAWRVVAADGHPVSGQFGFTVSVGPPPGTTITSPAAAASPTPRSEAPTSVATPGSGGHQQADGSSTAAKVVLGALVVLVLGFLMLVAGRVLASRQRAGF